MKNNSSFYGTGRRKESSARVFCKLGSGNFLINGIILDKYFYFNRWRLLVLYPFKIVGEKYLSLYDYYVTVKGGGLVSQAGSIRLGLSRILSIMDKSFKKKLKLYGFITRDSRIVERKKYGRRKSRSKPQYSKR